MYTGGARWEYDGPSRCPHTEDDGPLDGFRHDLGCWGLRTALYNLWWRLFHWDETAWAGDD